MVSGSGRADPVGRTGCDLSGGLPDEADLMLAEPPQAPFDWVREGASVWLFDEEGRFAVPRIGVEAEPHSWDNRRFAANFAFADGRVLQDAGLGPMPPVFDEAGRPSVLGGGPITFRCLEPFRRWRVEFDGMVVETCVEDQLAGRVDRTRRVPLRYRFELEMVVPPNIQSITPEAFFKLGKGEQRDAVSVGLGLRFEQLLRGEGELEVDGQRRAVCVSGSRVKRRSIRTDGLMLRGHCWQAAVFPDGRAFGFEVRPVHDDGFAPWNRGFVYQDGRMHAARVEGVQWLGKPVARGEDVSFELHSDVGVARIRGTTGLSTFRIASGELWGLNLQQGGALYEWDGQKAWGMIERSMPLPARTTRD